MVEARADGLRERLRGELRGQLTGLAERGVHAGEARHGVVLGELLLADHGVRVLRELRRRRAGPAQRRRHRHLHDGRVVGQRRDIVQHADVLDVGAAEQDVVVHLALGRYRVLRLAVLRAE